MAASDLIAVLDVGKSNVKLSIVAASTGATVSHQERPTHALDGPMLPQLDVRGIEEWLIASLAGAPGRERIRCLVPVAHGATAALVDEGGEVLVVPDYEASEFEQVAQQYREVRDPFEESYSPFLPRGLNLGRQLFFLQHHRATLFERADRILLYPQYWAWRCSGVAASEITSLGCHSDLWNPTLRRPSALAEREGWAALLPPMRSASDDLGPITEHFARRTGLDPHCRVLCGIHDSNASYLRHIASRPVGEPVAVVSSGTWTIVMARGTDLSRLRENRDMLANIDAFGQSVATARFMGGREYAAIAGELDTHIAPSADSAASVIRQGAMALPAFSASGGPFAHHAGRLIDAGALSGIERAALATLYCALMVDLLLDLLDSHGDLLIDGPLATNQLFPAVMAALRPGAAVFADGARESIVAGSVLAQPLPAGAAAARVTPIALAGLSDYRRAWRNQLPAGA